MRLQVVPLDALQAFGFSESAECGTAAENAPGLATDTPECVVSNRVRPGLVVVASSPDEDGPSVGDFGVSLAQREGIDLARRLRRSRATGAAGEAVSVPLEDEHIEQLIVLGLADGSPDAARQAGARLADCIRSTNKVLCAVTTELTGNSLRAFCEGLLLGSYSYSRKSTGIGTRHVLVQLVVGDLAGSQRQVDAALVTCRAVRLARDLANRPSNEKSPRWLARQAQDLGKAAGLRVRVIDHAALHRGGFGGLLAVGRGSANPPCLVVLERPAEPDAPHVVLVGKGITFDSGGLNIKPALGMPLMKTDMSGAAAVLAVMTALQPLGVRARVTGLLACAENMPDADAYRPEDVIVHYGGRTSEVFNTDAEGRLVLADALAYASAKLDPDVIIDVATLTGAATVALGRSFGALFTADDGLAAALQSAGRLSHDLLWRLPLAQDYRKTLDSDVADISHVPHGELGAGAIAAALFLREFVAAPRWAHLDIAGPARAEVDRDEIRRGATGFGVRVLLRWLESAPDLW